MKENRKYSVYIHTTPSNKYYVGISISPKDRWDYGYGYKSNEYFWRAIKKHGWNNIQHDIVFTNLSEKDAKCQEILLIEKYKSNDREFGYNHTKGGDLPAPNRCKTVYQFDKNGNYIDMFKTTRGAERSLKIDHNSINKCCNGKLKVAGGFVWRYNRDNNFNKITTDRCGKIIQINMTDLSIVHIFNNIEELENSTDFNRYEIYRVCELKKDYYKKYYWCYENSINEIKDMFKPKGVMQIDINTNKVLKMFPDIKSASIENKISLEAIRCAICGIQNTSSGYKWALI